MSNLFKESFKFFCKKRFSEIEKVETPTFLSKNSLKYWHYKAYRTISTPYLKQYRQSRRRYAFFNVFRQKQVTVSTISILFQLLLEIVFITSYTPYTTILHSKNYTISNFSKNSNENEVFL